MCKLCRRRRIAYRIGLTVHAIHVDGSMVLRDEQKVLVCKPCKDKLQGEVEHG